MKVEFPELVDKENIEVRRGFTIVLNEREEARNHAEALFGAIREVFKPYNIPKRKIKLKKGKFKKK